MRTKTILKGISSVVSLLLAILIATSALLFDNAGKINHDLNVSTSMAIEREGSETQNTTSNSSVEEADVASVTAQESSWRSTGSTAVVVLTRWGTEDSESAMLADDKGVTRRYMGLMKNEMDLLDYLKQGKASGMFKGIVAVVNSDQMMELGWPTMTWTPASWPAFPVPRASRVSPTSSAAR